LHTMLRSGRCRGAERQGVSEGNQYVNRPRRQTQRSEKESSVVLAFRAASAVAGYLALRRGPIASVSPLNRRATGRKNPAGVSLNAPRKAFQRPCSMST
jgi:hypothetical protein